VKRYEGVCRKDFGIAFVREVDQLKLHDDFRPSSEDDVTAAGKAVMAGTRAGVI
jgi:hypothetical protein